MSQTKTRTARTDTARTGTTRTGATDKPARRRAAKASLPPAPDAAPVSGIAAREAVERMMRLTALVYGVDAAAMGPRRGQQKMQLPMPPWLEARYCLLALSLERRLGFFGDAVLALGFQKHSAETINSPGMRQYRHLRARNEDTADRAVRILAMFDAGRDTVARAKPRAPQPATTSDAASRAASAAVYGPQRVPAARLREMRRMGWSLKGLARQFELDEATVRAVLGERLVEPV